MEHIRLTCGGCKRRYRLPPNATGYFRCKNCDLVMEIPIVHVPVEPAIPKAERISPNSSQGSLNGNNDFDVIESGDLDEIVFDPSTNELVHLTPSSSSSGLHGKHEARSPVAATPSEWNAKAPAQAHTKKSTGMQPSESACAFVGIGMVICGCGTILYQLLNSGGEQRPSVLAVCLSLVAALLGVAIAAMGFRKNKKVLIAVSSIGALVPLGLFGVAMISGNSEQIADADPVAEDSGVELYEPGESKFNIQNQKEKAEKRKKELEEFDKQMDSARKKRADRRRQDRELRNKRSRDRVNRSKDTNRDSSNGSGENPDRNIVQNSQAPANKNDLKRTSTAAGRYARKIEELWASKSPSERGQLIDEMRGAVDNGMDQANGSEVEYWEMYRDRLKAMSRFDDGNWVPLDFEYGLTGWHPGDKSGLKVSSESEVVVAAEAGGRRGALLSTADQFFGPLTIRATLSSNGNLLGPDAPRIGISFSNSSTKESAVDGGFCVLFDPALRNSWTGKGSGTQSEIPDRRIDSSRPVELLINVCPGYMQVFANKRLVLEKHDPGIVEAHAIRLAVVGGEQASCEFSVSDWKVRRWKAGVPPGKNAFVEEDLMYLSEAIEEFDDIAWYHYRYALALFGSKKYVKAAESAERAVEMGVPRKYLAIVFALQNELKKDYSRAIAEYVAAADGNSRELAKAWHAWFVLTHPDPGVRANGTANRIADDIHPIEWVELRIKAAVAAKRGDYTTALDLITNINRSSVPLKFRGGLGQQIRSYQASQPFTRSKTSLPFYHNLKNRIVPDEIQYESSIR